MDQSYNSYEVSETANGFIAEIISKKVSDLPDNEVLIRVKYSGLNYKDALSASGHKGITRNYPHTPGIDAAGIVEESSNPMFHPGQEVIVTSYDLGMNTSGGFGQFIRVPSEWVIPLPDKLSLRESMIYGTAGFTAAQGIHSMIRNGQNPEWGPVLVTGARGAVGGMAIMILSKLGYEVIAGVSEIAEDSEYLKSLGAVEVVDAEITNDQSKHPLLKPRWAGAFDVIGGNTLSTILKSTKYGGNVVCVGNIQGVELNTTVFPFILNGINLLGIGTQDTAMELRRKLWNLLADEWRPKNIQSTTKEIGFNELKSALDLMINKKSRGRVLLNLEKAN